MGRASLLLDYKGTQGPLVLQMVIWQLPRATRDRPFGIKYRLYLGRGGQTLVRYDNEAGKGDHRHVGHDEVEMTYEFSTVERLLADFRADCMSHGWRWKE